MPAAQLNRSMSKIQVPPSLKRKPAKEEALRIAVIAISRSDVAEMECPSQLLSLLANKFGNCIFELVEVQLNPDDFTIIDSSAANLMGYDYALVADLYQGPVSEWRQPYPYPLTNVDEFKKYVPTLQVFIDPVDEVGLKFFLENQNWDGQGQVRQKQIEKRKELVIVLKRARRLSEFDFSRMNQVIENQVTYDFLERILQKIQGGNKSESTCKYFFLLKKETHKKLKLVSRVFAYICEKS